MDNKPNNLYQPPQPSQPTEQPTPEPPKSNKLWPINWRHNRTLKIIGLISFFLFAIKILSVFVAFVFAFSGYRIFAESFLSYLSDLKGIFPLNAFFFLLIIFNIVIFLFKMKWLDKFDKMLLTINIFVGLFSLGLFVLKTCC